MVQPTLERYYHLSRPPRAAPKVTFLDLPFALRRRIYLNAGLPTQSAIYLNYVPLSSGHCDLEYNSDNFEQWPVEETVSCRSSSLAHFLNDYLPWPKIHLNYYCVCLEKQRGSMYPECKCDLLPYQLLYTSNTIAEEVSTIFYSENDFSIYRTGIGGLSSISRLPPQALGRIKSLSICLNFFDERGCEFGPGSGGKSERLFSNAKRHDERTALKEWQLLCQLLVSHLEIQSNFLKLFITCDVADFEIAEEFMRPLLHLPILKECSVRLGSPFINQSQLLTKLARRIVDKVTNRSAQCDFRYQDLPKELQLRILEYTELVTPFHLVWAFNTDVARYIESPYYENRTFHSSRSIDSSCCRKCSPEKEPCACWSGQAAFSTTCTCWKFPLSLFLVNRDMRKDAEFIFYSKNHFVLQPRKWNYSEQLEIYNFLTSIPANGRRYLQKITWSLSDLTAGDRYLEPDHVTYSEWLAAINIMTQEVLPRQLSLIIDPGFDLQSVLWSYGSEYEDVPEDCGTAEAEYTWTVCERLAHSLSRNNNLENLFIYFVWPFEKHKDGLPKDRGAILEKKVMGEEYDSRSRGKLERRC